MPYQAFDSLAAVAFAKQRGLIAADADVSCREIGDGNLNLVFHLQTADSSFIVKQALPYARCVGESWPLSLERARIEAEVLKAHGKVAPEWVVKVLDFDLEQYAMVEEDLSHLELLRKRLINAEKVDNMGQNLADYLADSLYAYSDFELDPKQKKALVSQFINPDLCLITEDLFFTDPYREHERNDIFPASRQSAEALWQDDELLARVAELKVHFLSCPQSLLHGDVHSGSVFSGPGELKVIDAEFGFFGPIGFDVGSVIGNLLLAWCRHHTLGNEAYAAWLVEQCLVFWQRFESRFSALLKGSKDVALVNARYQRRFVAKVLQDTLGYAGTELIRRTLGLAHVADITSLDDELRAKAEQQALSLGKALVLASDEATSIGLLSELLKKAPVSAAA
ncbi:S-methyl-5-thioribose kinase [Gallaecimonas pentaromativorans]|uniref:S-methyl-5-thioribose kinase n=1 Tax=Gallaecimonas pentaromativorans TaxID=584787 RepID=A0A3N1PEG4_9GAMM|nr:S-methyl-5-thioribose kinase [Gallaecimonas pentaromativorans]ROQ29852.1 5'-methylthioribose kinase [Gallaecimonas pentaromativorans]